MKLTNICVVFMKEIKDTIKNKAVLLQFVMFPCMVALMSNAVPFGEELPANFFVKMFGAMYVGMAPLIIATAIISEEKETNTLRMLLFSNVKGSEYLLGVGGYVFLFCSIGAFVISLFGQYTMQERLIFLLLCKVAILISIFIGGCIGLACKNQMSANSISVPIMMICSFIPMLSMFNETIKQIGEYVYTQQVNLMFENLSFSAFSTQSITVLFVTLGITLGMFMAIYRRNKTLLS